MRKKYNNIASKVVARHPTHPDICAHAASLHDNMIEKMQFKLRMF